VVEAFVEVSRLCSFGKKKFQHQDGVSLMCAPCCHFCLLFCLIEDPSRRIFGQKLFLNQSKNSDDIFANSIFLLPWCKAGDGGERAGLEFWLNGVGVSVAAGSGVCARLHLGRFVGWVWNVLGLGGGFAGVFCVRRERVGFWNSGRERRFWLPRAGWVNGWCMERS
jgi:hypothetical protein